MRCSDSHFGEVGVRGHDRMRDGEAAPGPRFSCALCHRGIRVAEFEWPNCHIRTQEVGKQLHVRLSLTSRELILAAIRAVFPLICKVAGAVSTT